MLTRLQRAALIFSSFFSVAALTAGMQSAGQAIDEDLEGYFWYDNVSVSLGASAMVVPLYSGASNYEFTGFPLVDLDYKKFLFLSTQRGLGVQFKPFNPLVLGTRLLYNFGRDNQDHVKYMSNLAGCIDGGVFARLLFGSWIVNGDFQTAISQQGHQGSYGGLSLAYFYTRVPYWEFLTRGGLTFGSGNYMNAYYGVTEGEAVRTGFDPYEPGAGFNAGNVAFTATFIGIKNWKILSTVGMGALSNKAADSDVVQARMQYMASLGAVYVF